MSTSNPTDDLFAAADSPESVGIPSRAILRFLDRIHEQRTCMHGVLLLRHGRVAAEGYWAPWTAKRKHRMYSVSKSFVSLAIGLMRDEGRLRLDDRIVDYFPDELPAKVHPWIADSTIRDLLMMATVHTQTTYTSTDRDWAWTFFNTEPSHPPGTIFSYDTSATVVLGTIVERLAGEPFLDYLRPRLLDPVGFSRDAWCVRTPEGTSWGGSGVICTLRDLAKVALVCTRDGRWGDRQLISRGYVREATAKQIDNSLGGNDGYGYQIWREPGDGFSFRGMGSQFAVCYPERDFVFTCIADTQGDGPTGVGVLAPMREELLASVSDTPIPEDPEAAAELRDRLASLRVLPQPGGTRSPLAPRVNKAWYHLRENPMGITRMRFTFGEDEGIWEYANARGTKALRFGMGRTVAGTFPERHYFGGRIGTSADREYECLASAAWVEEGKLDLQVHITDDYLGSLKATFAFKGDEIAIFMTKVAEWFLDEYEGFAGGSRTDAG